MRVKDKHLIRELRQERGLTQRQLGTLAKCSQATISAIEVGELKTISVDLGVHLSKWLDRRPRELFEEFSDEEFRAVEVKTEARRTRQRSSAAAAA